MDKFKKIKKYLRRFSLSLNLSIKCSVDGCNNCVIDRCKDCYFVIPKYCMKHIEEKVDEIRGYSGWSIEPSGIDKTIADGDLCEIKKIHKMGIPFNETAVSFYCHNITYYAAKRGQLKIFKYIIKHGGFWDSDTYVAAAESGQLEMLKYLHKNEYLMALKKGLELDLEGNIMESEERFELDSEGNTLPSFNWDTDTCAYAAMNGQLGCLDYAHTNGCPWDSKTCEYAAYDSIECLIYAHIHGCPWNSKVCDNAISQGRLNIFEYAIENGCPCDNDICTTAAAFDKIEMLKYLHEKGYHWDESTCANASRNDSIECLKYAHENGCPWDSNTCSEAVGLNSIECLEYAHTHGCPWDSKACELAIENVSDNYDYNYEICKHEIKPDYNFECLRYLYENRCPGWEKINTDFETDSRCPCRNCRNGIAILNP